MRFTYNCDAKGYRTELWHGLFQFQDIRARFVRAEMEMVITSLNDSSHIPGSKHYEDLAADIRSHDLDHETKHKVLTAAITEMPTYKIIIEYEFLSEEHFHLEFASNGTG